jgi:hypothetical protein
MGLARCRYSHGYRHDCLHGNPIKNNHQPRADDYFFIIFRNTS